MLRHEYFVYCDSSLLHASLEMSVKRKHRHKNSQRNDLIDNSPNLKCFIYNLPKNDNGSDEYMCSGKFYRLASKLETIFTCLFIVEKQQNMENDNKYLIGMKLRDIECQLFSNGCSRNNCPLSTFKISSLLSPSFLLSRDST